MANPDLFLLMSTAQRGSTEYVRQALPPKDRFSPLALSILKIVNATPGMAQGEIGQMLRRDPMTMSQAVRSLEKGALVSGKVDREDRRVKRLSPTRKGQTLCKTIVKHEKKLLGGLSRSWGKNKLNQFMKQMAEFNDHVGSLSDESQA